MRRVANFVAPQYNVMHLSEIGQYNEVISDKRKLPAANCLNEAFNENINNGGDVNEVLSLSPTSLLRAKMRAKFQRPSLDQARENLKTPIQKDLDRYESYSLADSNVDILEWWRTHENTLPILSQIAKQVLTIPASSAKSERVFSTGGNIVTKK